MKPHLPPQLRLRACAACATLAPWLFVTPALRADDTASPPPNAVSLVSDDFERTALAPWNQVIPTFTVENGVLKGSQTRDDHGSVGAVEAHFKDAFIEFKFKLEGSTGFNVVCDDKNYKGSHAGHICRVAIVPKAIRLGDDKEGVMRNDIFEMRRDPARKAEGDKLAAGRMVSFPATIESHRWYHVVMKITGDEMQVSLDGKPVGSLKSPGLAHPTKTHFHFTVNGRDALFDDVRIWSLDSAVK